MLLISRALVSSSGCGQQQDHQGRATAPTDGEQGRLHRGATGPEATAGIGTSRRPSEGGSWAPGVASPAEPWPIRPSLCHSPWSFLTSPPECRCLRALKTPREQGLEYLSRVQGGRGGVDSKSKGASESWPSLWSPHTPFLVGRRPQRPTVLRTFYPACVCTPACVCMVYTCASVNACVCAHVSARVCTSDLCVNA